ncbi:MAG: hypothetical protein JWP10_788 [Nocardioidaceae bacterium]|nr:hypothetical protein [Nocardioidaceae bacterium]
MTLQITVRGSATKSFAPERAVVSISAAFEGRSKDQVFAEAVAAQEFLSAQLANFSERGSVTSWSADQVYVHSEHPSVDAGRRAADVHLATTTVSADFVDFELLNLWLDAWGGKDGVEIGGIGWDVSAANRRSYESEVRGLAVDDAVAKAQAYADAVGRGKVSATQFADPGMLVSLPSPGFGGPMMAMASRKDMAPTLDLRPANIDIYIEVDAIFVAD